MEEKLSGIVISGVNYGDNDKIINVLTLEKGLISLKSKGVMKAGAKLKFATEPFCFVEYIVSKKGSFRTLIGASLIDSFYPIRESVEKFYSASVMVEFAKKFLREEIIASDLFVSLLEGLKSLAYGTKNPIEITVKYLLSALKYTGYSLNLEGCYKCGCEIENKTFFVPLSGGFVCERCKEEGDMQINSSTLIALKEINKGSAVERENAVRCLRLINYYIVNKTEERLKTLEALIKMCN